ncbi:MAG: 16S rRNA processing protein RimM [Acidimicrobiaceae bacterium]|nr:16S rRNA processing protein RimM [Acidimicrobiaceae bacterium]MEC7844952.1 ribosome maturation factor RimM [Actinomycetota bacterium]
MKPVKLLEIGRIGKPHGLRGEVTILLTTDRKERISAGSVLFLDSKQELIVQNSRSHKKRFLVLFKGMDTRESAEKVSGEKLFAEPLKDETTIWVHELIGKIVVDSYGCEHGEVVEIHANPASDLLVLDDGTLVPITFLSEIEEETIIVRVPKGIFPD